ncbi:MAG: class I SAM-dependent methyltransferase [Thiotrichales bacterium]
MTNIDETIRYHLRELEIALDAREEHHIMPPITETDRAILDIGCGIGQTLVAADLPSDAVLVGLDLDHHCLAYGRNQFDRIAFVNGVAEGLPFREGVFDLVVSRVSVPYTEIQRTLNEVKRVLKPHGRLWFTLHPYTTTRNEFLNSLRHLRFGAALRRAHVLLNGALFHLTGRQIALVKRWGHESFQTRAGMKRALHASGFTDIQIEFEGKHFVCVARRLP